MDGWMDHSLISWRICVVLKVFHFLPQRGQKVAVFTEGSWFAVMEKWKLFGQSFILYVFFCWEKMKRDPRPAVDWCRVSGPVCAVEGNGLLSADGVRAAGGVQSDRRCGRGGEDGEARLRLLPPPLLGWVALSQHCICGGTEVCHWTILVWFGWRFIRMASWEPIDRRTALWTAVVFFVFLRKSNETHRKVIEQTVKKPSWCNSLIPTHQF